MTDGVSMPHSGGQNWLQSASRCTRAIVKYAAAQAAQGSLNTPSAPHSIGFDEALVGPAARSDSD